MATTSARWWVGLLLLLLLLALVWSPAHAQWGVPKGKKGGKKEDAVRVDTDSAGGMTFGEKQRQAQNHAQIPLADLTEGIDWNKLMEDALEDPEVQELMNDPEKLREVLQHNPLLRNMDGWEKVLDSEELKDPNNVRKLFQKGMEQFKDGLNDWMEAAKDPAKMNEMIESYAGDMDEWDKERTKKLLEGDPDTIEEVAKELGEAMEKAGQEYKKEREKMNDPKYVDDSRKKFKETKYNDPDLKKAADDPSKWKEVMEENLKLLYEATGNEL